MRPVRNVFQKLSRTEQRREGVVAYLWSPSQRKVERQVKVLITNLAILFPFPSKELLPISLKKFFCLLFHQSPSPPHTVCTVLTVLTEQKLKQEWQNSPTGTRQTDSYNLVGLEKQKENQPNYQRLLLLTVLPLNYFMVSAPHLERKPQLCS